MRHGLWAWLLAPLVAGCGSFGPNLTGRWRGTCEDDALTVTLVVELADVDTLVDGDFAGELRVTTPSDDTGAAPVEQELSGVVEGERQGRTVQLSWRTLSASTENATNSPSAVWRADGELQLSGPELSGTLTPGPLESSRCALVLER